MADMTEGSAGLRIVLLGKTGAGKSSTANSLLGEKLFTTSCLANSDTATCKAASKTVDGRKITVVDTPGYFSTEYPDEEQKTEIVKCITECSPGPHAFLIVLTVTRQTAEEKKVVANILKTFGEDALKYAIVLFTHGDQLDDNVTIQEFVDKNDHLKTLVQKCGNRFHVLDNKYWNNPTEGPSDERSNAVQIKKLLNTIDQMVTQNGGEHYTNGMFQAVARVIEQEMVNITKETGEQLPEITVIERAREKVKRFLIQTAGVSTGVLLGALLGAAVPVAKVVASFAVVIGNVYTSPCAAAAALTKVDSTTFMRLGVVAGVGALGGAISGGKIGSNAAKEAKTAKEATETVLHALSEQALVEVNNLKNEIEDKIQKGSNKKHHSF